MTLSFIRLLWFGVIAGSLAVAACDDDATHTHRAQQAACLSASALMGGTASGDYLGLSAAQRAAVVALWFVDRRGGRGELCSGVLLAERWVLTAGHCVDVDADHAEVALGEDVRCTEHTVRSARVLVHPTLDVAAIELVDSISALALPIAPLALASERLSHLDPSALVELAGYGKDASLAEGRRSFVTEALVAADEQTFTVDGRGLSGACVGDSGGPLLHRRDDGVPVVLGVLSQGDVSCLGRDQYVRLDAARAWLRELGVTPSPHEGHDCGEIDGAGRCLGQLSVWCEAGALHAEACEEPSRCAFDEARARFACLQEALGPCSDVDQAGICKDGAALRCQAGRLVKEDCTNARGCVREPVTGEVRCRARTKAAAGGAAQE